MVKRITSLIYHSVEAKGSARIREEERFYNITPDKFRKQMRYLKENGYSTIGLDELIQIDDERNLPEKPVILTFDDGHLSHYDTVLPILKELGLGAVFFIVVDDVGKKYRMSWNKIKVLKSAGMDIGSHSLRHVTLDKASYQSLIFELKASKIELEENLESKILAFSIPTGMYSRRISDVARGMGYKLVFTSFMGNITLYSNPHCLRRIGVRSEYSMEDFISIVRKDTGFLVKRRVEQFAKNRIKDVIGIKGYDKVKQAVIARG